MAFDTVSMRCTRLSFVALALAAIACGSDTSTDPNAQDRAAIVHAWPFPDSSRQEFHLVLRKADGTPLRRLVDLSGFESFPEWSPDGRQVIFTRSNDDRLWLVGENGANPHPLLESAARVGSWSPDGKMVAFQRQVLPLSQEIFVANANGSGVRSLTHGQLDDAFGMPSWSPDGRIAFRRSRTGIIWSVRADGSGLAPLTSENGDYWPRWSPDGSRLAFLGVMPISGLEVVFVMNADGTGRRQLTPGITSSADYNPSWSPDGQWIMYEHHPYASPSPSCSLHKVSVTTGEDVVLVAPRLATTCRGASWRR